MKNRNSSGAPRRTFVALCALVSSAAGVAAEPAPAAYPEVTLRGFGTAGLVYSDVDRADFVGGFFHPNGVGAARRLDHTVDSRLGLQLDARFTDKLSAVLQVVAQDRHDNAYALEVEWANVKYQLTPDAYVRAGRMVTTPFLLSETRLVGYAYPWVRPPQEVYGLIPLTNKDGIDAAYRLYFGDVAATLRTSYGETSAKLPEGGGVKAKHYFDVSGTVEHGAAALRLSYSRGRVDLHTPDLDAVVNGLAQFGAASAGFGLAAQAAQANALSQKYSFQNAPITVLALGASYDKERWLGFAEWAKFGGHSILADSTAWYVTGGYRFGAWTPYVTLARLRAETRSEAGISTAGLPPPLAAMAGTLNTGLNTLLAGATFAQRSVSAGARWDFMRNAALKVQYDRIDLDAGSSGRLGNVQPGFAFGRQLNVFSVALDFVF